MISSEIENPDEKHKLKWTLDKICANVSTYQKYSFEGAGYKRKTIHQKDERKFPRIFYIFIFKSIVISKEIKILNWPELQSNEYADTFSNRKSFFAGA